LLEKDRPITYFSADLDSDVVRFVGIGPGGSLYDRRDGVMPKLQIIKTPQGERLAVLPMAEYQRLQEAAAELEDVRAYDEAKRRLATGEDELLPHEFMVRMVDGENPIRVWRDYRGLKMRELAEAAGISSPYLSQIESGDREGSFDTMRRIAEALKVSLDDLTPATPDVA
jgi:DNA-binding XRE family transcriptional regulator